ncbi:hypothetical protein CYMTET_17436 [Cymbomonas tetramitiformis]|uniref:Uncharacterized protein n=1 Tax=Cymbomonas tetramitiformis TaxID=36881 RepID=A0AAE0GA40_9CHLO|nr:hypothetical protein CYMTET_17432 [Cymbomonas tetramitiformis]KAK3274387.1 hypothetical protein CYMTET_17436 [Cymbomonas tetramitiformis]
MKRKFRAVDANAWIACALGDVCCDSPEGGHYTAHSTRKGAATCTRAVGVVQHAGMVYYFGWMAPGWQRVGLNPASYAGHSLRRGGATAAMRLDVNSIHIKMQRDWKSDCFERNCELDTEQRLILPGP